MNDPIARAWTRGSPAADAGDEWLRLADLAVDPRRGKAFRRNIDLGLSATLFGLLEVLMAHRGHVMTRESLIQAVWGSRKGLPDNIVTVAILRLRRKLDDPFDLKLIHTVHRVGYVLGPRDVAGGRDAAGVGQVPRP